MRDRPFQVSDSRDGAKTSEQEISARGWGVGREGFNSSLPLPFFPFAFFLSLFISCPFQLSGCLKKASLCCILKDRTAATFIIKHGCCAVTKRLSIIKVVLSQKTQQLAFLWLAPWWKIREICTRRFLHFVIIIDDRSFYVNPVISDDQLFKLSWFPTCHLLFFAFKALIILLGWLQKRPVLEMFTIGVRLVQFSVQLFTLRSWWD